MENQKIEQVSRVLLSMQRYSWEQGVAAQAYLESGDMQTAILFAREAVQRQDENGRLACMHSGEGVTDPAASGEALLTAVRLTNDPLLKAGLDAMLEYLMKRAPRAQDGTIFHVPNAKEVWVDSIYMAPPFLAAAGHVEEALLQLTGFKKRLWNPQAGLYAHIWNEERQTFTRAAHWGVGNGWAAAGITRVIRTLAGTQAHEAERLLLERHVREIIDGCLAHQRPDGLFHDVLDDPKSFVETNLAQMLAYSIYRGVTGGWLPAAYTETAEKMRAAVLQKVDDFGYVRGVCAAPTFDHAGTAPEGQAFFLLMEAARKDSLKQ